MTHTSESPVHFYSDGASRGNPGLAATGYWAEKGGRELLRGGEFLGQKTNNEAEYLALCTGLKRLIDEGLAQETIVVHADSELMIRQLQGKYKVKADGLKALHQQALALLTQFRHYRLTHIRRENNKLADQLANEAIDRHAGVS